jgi:hypothetical protein
MAVISREGARRPLDIFAGGDDKPSGAAAGDAGAVAGEQDDPSAPAALEACRPDRQWLGLFRRRRLARPLCRLFISAARLVGFIHGKAPVLSSEREAPDHRL